MPSQRVRQDQAVRQLGQGLWQIAAAVPGRVGLVAVDALGEPVAPRWYSDRFKALSRVAGVPVVRLHDARHACGSYMLDQAMPLPIVAGFLGHASPDFTASVFAHAVKDDNTHERIRQALMAAGL